VYGYDLHHKRESVTDTRDGPGVVAKGLTIQQKLRSESHDFGCFDRNRRIWNDENQGRQTGWWRICIQHAGNGGGYTDSKVRAVGDRVAYCECGAIVLTGFLNSLQT
jgi:hypothetical protein